jgi:hypothetical protein
MRKSYLRSLPKLCPITTQTGEKLVSAPPSPCGANTCPLCDECIKNAAAQPDEHVGFMQLTLDVISWKSNGH